MKKILISEYVKSLRKESMMNVRDFGAKYGISKAQVSKYETGKNDDPSLVTATGFCKTFNISLEMFGSEFYYTNKKLKEAISLVSRLKNETKSFSNYDCSENFYLQYKEKSGLSKYEKCNQRIDYKINKNNGIIIESQTGKCLSKEKEEIWICVEKSVPEVPSAPKNINYEYSLSEIVTVASISSKDLGCSNFVFIVSNKRMYNYFKNLHFHSYNTNAYIAYTEDELHFKEINKLFGKDFLQEK